MLEELSLIIVQQRLGEVILKQKDDEEISLFDWTLESAARVSDLMQRGTELQSQITKRDREIEDLKERVQNAAKERDLYVKQLSLKFSELLNSKKAKIRDQQRLLKSASITSPIDTDGANDEPSASTTAKGKKRKAENGAIVEPPEDDDATEDEEEGNMSDAASSRTRTPTPDAETSGDESDGPASKVASDNKRRANSKPSQSEPARTIDSSSRSKDWKIPPRRELPVGMGGQGATTAKAQPSAPEDDEEETDDEL